MNYAVAWQITFQWSCSARAIFDCHCRTTWRSLQGCATTRLFRVWVFLRPGLVTLQVTCISLSWPRRICFGGSTRSASKSFSPWIRRRHAALWSHAQKAPRSVHMPVSMPMWWIVKCGVVKLKVQAGRFSRQKCTARIPDTYARNSMHRCEWIRKDMTEGSVGEFSKLGESTVMCIDQVYKWSKLFFITS